jgi:hypothetical protein
VVTETDEASATTRAQTVGTLYAEISASVRTTDEISFKLLGLVPLVSGGGIFLLLDASKRPDWSAVTIFVALFGAAVTFAIYRWEVRNIQTCKSLIARGAELEEKELGLATGQFLNRDPEPTLFGWIRQAEKDGEGPPKDGEGPPKVPRWKMGKSGAERLLYTITIIAWLLLPIVAAVSD